MEKILIAGGTGLVGKQLRNLLSSQPHTEVYILTRNPRNPEDLRWNPSDKTYDPRASDCDHIINLAGAGIADGRWTAGRKKEILDSRIQSTELLVELLKKQNKRVKSFISASAIGYYGDGGEKWLYEDTSAVTQEFLSEVCIKWEEAATAARDVSDHLCILRIGTVLSTEGGALPKMTMTLPVGIANYFGNGNQYMSWIHEYDLAQMINYCISTRLDGIYNAVAPEVLTNKAFMNSLIQAGNHKALLLPAPAIGLKVALGEMSRVVLNSSRVSADKIMHAGFTWTYPTATEALKELLN